MIPVGSGHYDLEYIDEDIYDLIYEAGFEVFVDSDKIYLTGTVVGMGIYAEDDDIAEIHIMNILDIK